MTRPDIPPAAESVALSRHLRDYMTENGLSVEDVAAAMGRSRSFVSDHTNGLRAPDTDMINTVANLTRTSFTRLMLDLVARMV
jgi:transcriptional regulator with XRE-family HTH domain